MVMKIRSDALLLRPDNAIQFALSKLARGAFLSPNPLFAVDIVEGDKSITYSFDMPGVKLADINVSVTDDSLSVKAERRETRNLDTEFSHVVERTRGKYERIFPLSAKIDQDSIETTLQQGVLTIKFAKKSDAKLPKKVKIQQLS